MNTVTSTTLRARARRPSIRASVLAIAILLFGNVAFAQTATPAAGTVIGNQATATYQDTTGTIRTTASNLVQTTVSQVRSFTLTANGAKTAAPGQTVYYPHTITNTGNGADTYALNAATTGGAFTHTGLVYYIDANGDGLPDNATPITSSGAIPAGGQFRYVVAGVVPAGATAGQTGTITLTATDTAANTASNTDTTTVANSVINVTKALSTTSGPSPSTGPITVTLSFTNSGTQAAANVALTDALPSGMTYVANSGRWSASGATALSDAAGGDPAGINYTVTGSTVSATITSVAAGVSGTVTFQITVASGQAPTTPANAANTTNTATFATSTQTTANTNSVTYSVLQTAAVSATGATVAAAGQGGTVSFTNAITNNGTGTDSFDITFPAPGSPGNNFPAGTTFALYQSDGATTLFDSNGDGRPDTGPLAPGASYNVVLRATLPTSATGGPFSVTKTATSALNPTVTATATDTLTVITNNTVDLTNNTARADSTPAGTAAAGNAATTGFGPGVATVIVTNTVTPAAAAATTSAFQLYVNNTGASADSYNLSVTSALPTGWTVTFFRDGGAGNCSTLGAALTNTGPLAAGRNTLVCAVANIPPANTGNAPAGTSNITYQVQSPTTPGAADTIVDAVTVNAVHNVVLTPNGAQQTFPGGAVTYVHTLSNRGNAAETATFPAGFLTDSQIAAGWTSALYIDTNGNGVLDVGTDAQVTTATTLPLAVNASATLFVRVFAPGSASPINPPDVTTVTATYNGGASTASANDTTTVTNGLLLVKDQVAVLCTNLTPSGYSTAAIPAGPSTAPGQCIAYRITATNTTAGAITGIVLSDNIPANTTRADSCGVPAATGGATVGGTSANGAGGTVTASLATLASTASFQLTFCARINP